LAQNDPASDEGGRRAGPSWSRENTSDGGSAGSQVGPDVMGTQPAAEIDALYRSHQQSMVRLARLLTGSPAVAEEIVQEAFIKFARSAGKKDEPAAYLRVIVVNLSRSQQRRTLLERRLAPEAPVLSGIADIDETWGVLRRLPFRQRAVLMLRYYEDLPEADIARLLGCRPGTVKSALHRGLAALRKELGDRNGEHEGRQRDA
jgi:RNA polymerase sigma-70 factor (sigma-E family)